MKPLGLVVGESDGDEYHKVAFPIAFGTVDRTLYSLVGVEEGQKVTIMNGKSADARERTARLATTVLNAELPVDVVVEDDGDEYWED